MYANHYFNFKNELCRHKSRPFMNSFEVKINLVTACGLSIKRISIHTGNKGEVDCLKCLKKLKGE